MQGKDVKRAGAAVFPLAAAKADDLAAIVERIGADPRSLRYLGPKRRVLHLFVPEVDYRAAAFVKQELLARGGDALVARGVIDGTCRTSGVLMMGTDSQIDRLLQKLESLDCWGLPELHAALSSAVRGLRADRWCLALPGGRSLELNRETKVMGILNRTPSTRKAASRVRTTCCAGLRRCSRTARTSWTWERSPPAPGPSPSPRRKSLSVSCPRSGR